MDQIKRKSAKIAHKSENFTRIKQEIGRIYLSGSAAARSFEFALFFRDSETRHTGSARAESVLLLYSLVVRNSVVHAYSFADCFIHRRF